LIKIEADQQYVENLLKFIQSGGRIPTYLQEKLTSIDNHIYDLAETAVEKVENNDDSYQEEVDQAVELLFQKDRICEDFIRSLDHL